MFRTVPKLCGATELADAVLYAAEQGWLFADLTGAIPLETPNGIEKLAARRAFIQLMQQTAPPRTDRLLSVYEAVPHKWLTYSASGRLLDWIDALSVAERARAKRSQGLLAGAALVALLAFGAAAQAQVLEGTPRIIDGDTVEIGGTHIRFHGSDAPESDQTCNNATGQVYDCGNAATEALRWLVGTQSLRCVGIGLDRYGRTIASCYLPDGQDVERWMVRSGYSIAYRHFSMDYAADEDAAKAEHRGIWAGSFEEPYLWRKEHPHFGYSHPYNFTYQPYGYGYHR
jgi:endonuclease YncB( thermonuclease family)